MVTDDVDEAWPCFEIAVVDGVWRERDLQAIARLGRPMPRSAMLQLIESWLDNAAHLDLAVSVVLCNR